ncbi:MAG TPA: aldehyde dehydrogenase family protein, partial [Nakamurella sp.]
MTTTLTAAPERPMLIGGEWVAGADGVWTDVVSPGRRGTVLAQVPEGSAEDADRAVRAARAAFPAWRALHFKDRQKILLKIADALEDHAEELALLTAADTGNALRTQARPESQTLVNLFRYFGGVAGEFKGTVLPAGDDQLQYTRREPLGVVAGILPWNSPLMIAGMKTPAALAAGNTLVLKTAEDAPLTILRMAEICSEFLPPGVLNVITGKGSVIGEALLVHPDVDKVSFTGSTGIGRHVAETVGQRLAHVSLELGGKSPNIVFPDAATP